MFRSTVSLNPIPFEHEYHGGYELEQRGVSDSYFSPALHPVPPPKQAWGESVSCEPPEGDYHIKQKKHE